MTNILKNGKDVSKLEVYVNDFSKGLDVSTGENITSVSTSVNCYNFNYNKGVLTEGMGVNYFCPPRSQLKDKPTVALNYSYFDEGLSRNIKALNVFRYYSRKYSRDRDVLIFYADDGYLWHLNLNVSAPTPMKMSQLDYENCPRFFFGKVDDLDNVFVSNGVEDVGFWDGDSYPIKYDYVPKFISLCNYKNVWFYITTGDRKYLKYCLRPNLNRWVITADTAYQEFIIDLKGEQGNLNRLMNFDKYLYIFRDYGIDRLSLVGEKKEIQINHIYKASNRIYANTVEICGDEMIMLTQGGLISFDGVEAKTIDMKFASKLKGVDNQNAVASFYDGKYYLACKMNYDDEKQIGCEQYEDHQNNTLIEYDPHNKTCAITRGIDIFDMKSIQAHCLNKLVISFNKDYTTRFGELTTDGKFFDSNTNKYWCSPLTDLGYSNKKKIIKEVSLLSKYDCKLTIFTETEQKVFKVEGSQTISKFPVRLTGKQVGFKIETTSQKAYVSNLRLDVDLQDMGNAI